MPYKLEKEGSGYKVISKNTGKAHSNSPISKEKAKSQMRALYANMKKMGERS